MLSVFMYVNNFINPNNHAEININCLKTYHEGFELPVPFNSPFTTWRNNSVFCVLMTPVQNKFILKPLKAKR